MTLALSGALVGIALFDSLNPTLFLAQFYLIATPKPTARLLSYLAGVVAVNFTGGLLLLGGAQAFVAEFLQSLGPGTLYALQLALGAALLVFGLLFKATASYEVKVPRSLRPAHAFALGAAVMLSEITTALPYFFAVERIARAQLPLVGDLLALGLYNLVFSLPLLAFLALFLAYRQRFSAQLGRLSRAVQVWTPRVLKVGALAAGLLLALNALAYLALGVALF